MITGAYVRARRNGKFGSFDIAECSEDELDSLAELCPLDGWKWTKFLVRWIQENVKEGCDACKEKESDRG